MIAQISRGNHMPDLVSYLFGPGRHNEHVNQHLVAGDADAVFSAEPTLWQPEPGITRHLRDEARELGWQVEFPHSRWETEVPPGYVWHCSLSLKAEEGQLTDASGPKPRTLWSARSASTERTGKPRAGGSRSATASPRTGTTTFTSR